MGIDMMILQKIKIITWYKYLQAIVGCFIFTTVMLPSEAVSADHPVVSTSDGQIKGQNNAGINTYLGIPYALPPVGPLRWKPPVAVRHWNGILDASHFASNCPQVTEFGAFAGPASINEDCLYLNVFTTDNLKNTEKKPVIVWIHGGANIDGSSSDYDGSKLARGGSKGVETVVVTLNYRLGLFGTFSHPAINSKNFLWGNYGILDQQLALQWVKRNIQAFGGDPDNVTIGGQSAGAYNVGANVVSPLSHGLFRHAIFQSSPAVAISLPTAEDTTKKGIGFAEAAGCQGSDDEIARCLRSLSASRILQLQGTPAASGPFVQMFPFIDGKIIPIPTEEALKKGDFNKVSIMGGSTHDEMTFLTGIMQYFSGQPMTTQQYNQAITPGAFCVGCKKDAMPEGVAKYYPLSKYDNNAMIAYTRVTTDIVKCREFHMLSFVASQVPTYAYDFTYQNAPYYFPKMPGFQPLAAHTIDIQFIFDKFHGGPLGVNLDQKSGMPRDLDSSELILSDQMISFWTRFAESGNPNGTGDTPWPRFHSDNSGTYYVQDIPESTKTVSQMRSEYQCDFWDNNVKY
ncbi:Carboxylesterase type B [Yersinia frederiksenii ATCC 33641]|nr:carboxylesterase family protein [Yersinia frederiksenii]EEQ15135.1 Carboxylesterase type B [Yersinia frederiksenii ATCC 33641]